MELLTLMEWVSRMANQPMWPRKLLAMVRSTQQGPVLTNKAQEQALKTQQVSEWSTLVRSHSAGSTDATAASFLRLATYYGTSERSPEPLKSQPVRDAAQCLPVLRHVTV